MANKEAMYWKKFSLVGKKVRCELCPHSCLIDDQQVGICKVRKNINGKLTSLVYGMPISTSFDFIEKKPLYHFFPGQKTFSFGTVGCNLKCLFCQNAEISQANPEAYNIKKITPRKMVTEAKKESNIISYTYTEPTVFYEYMLDISKIARDKQMKNVIVSNGFINEKPMNELLNCIDAANIDLKSMNEEIYRRVCGGSLNPVLETLKRIYEKGVWLEITNLIVPGMNDSLYDIRTLISWIKNNLGVDVPVHFSAFYPCYKMTEKPSTNPEILKKARKIAMEVGLNYVYTGNINDEEGSTTYCPNCRKPVIVRNGFNILQNKLVNGKCPCGKEIPGVWE